MSARCSAREDAYTLHVRSDRAENSGDRRAVIASPKASVILAPSRWAELYVSGGYGFHSNDARGTEVGLRATTVGGLRSTVSLWALTLDSELLFTGDAGTTGRSAVSRRSGVTFADFYRPVASGRLSALALDADVSFERARFSGVDAGQRARRPGGVDDVHVHPVEPRQLRLALGRRF